MATPARNSSHTLGSVASPSPNASAFGLPICRGLVHSGLEITLPLICTHVEYGDRSWKGVLCHPFWDYATLQLLVFFVLVFVMRKYAKEKIGVYQKRQKETMRPPMASSPQTRRSTAPPTPHLGYHSSSEKLFNLGDSYVTLPSQSPESMPPTPKNTAKQRGIEYLHRVFLQIFQWWILIILVLLHELWRVFQMLDAQYGLYNSIFWPMIRGLPRTKPELFADIPDWLAWFSIYSLPALLLIYALCIVCILLQVLTHILGALFTNCCDCIIHADGSAMMMGPRDVSIQVLLLPMVYGCLAIRSVMCMWSSLTNQYPSALSCSHWDARLHSEESASTEYSRKVMFSVYESNFALADVYESWALYCFARMLARVLRSEINTSKIKQPHEFTKAFKGLLIRDVVIFVVIELLSAFYSIFLAWTQWRFGIDTCDLAPSFCIFSPYLLGAEWCISSIAIYNLVWIEFRFHARLKSFGPRLKFGAIKLMVLVSFWSGIFMPIVQGALKCDMAEAKLLDASFRIYTMAFVAVLNVFAWWPWKHWWAVTKEASDRKKKIEEYISECGEDQNDPPPPGTISLVKELFQDLVDEEDQWKPEQWEAVKHQIENMKPKDLQLLMFRGSQAGWIVESTYAQQYHSSPLTPFRSSFGQTMKTVMFGPSGSPDPDPRPLQVLIHCSHEERKRAILAHLAGFYHDARI